MDVDQEIRDADDMLRRSNQGFIATLVVLLMMPLFMEVTGMTIPAIHVYVAMACGVAGLFLGRMLGIAGFACCFVVMVGYFVATPPPHYPGAMGLTVASLAGAFYGFHIARAKRRKAAALRGD